MKQAAWALMGPRKLVSCWYQQDYESAAMWGLYAGASRGVAIKSTVGQLIDALRCPDPVYVGRVEYLDYQTDLIPEDNLFSPNLCKRRSFEHEREVQAMRFATGVPGEPPPPGGEPVSVDVSHLILAAHTAPSGPVWCHELVGEVTGRHHRERDTGGGERRRPLRPRGRSWRSFPCEPPRAPVRPARERRVIPPLAATTAEHSGDHRALRHAVLHWERDAYRSVSPTVARRLRSRILLAVEILRRATG